MVIHDLLDFLHDLSIALLCTVVVCWQQHTSQVVCSRAIIDGVLNQCIHGKLRLLLSYVSLVRGFVHHRLILSA